MFVTHNVYRSPEKTDITLKNQDQRKGEFTYERHSDTRTL